MIWIWHCGVRVAAAVLFGAVFHAAWVALFIFAASCGASGIVKAILWLNAPVVTAAGFATGLMLRRRNVPQLTGTFARTFVTPFIGCAIGAVVMSPIGPMLVGLGVLGGGTVAVAIRCYWDGRGTGQHDGVV